MKWLVAMIILAALALTIGASLTLAAVEAERAARLATLNQELSPDNSAFTPTQLAPSDRASREDDSTVTFTAPHGIGEPEAYALPHGAAPYASTDGLAPTHIDPVWCADNLPCDW